MSLRITGKLPSGKYKERIQASPNYRNGAFQNLSPTPMKSEGISYWKMMREFFKKHPDTAPPARLPSIRTDLRALRSAAPVMIWFGHSSYFLRIENRNFLIDPVFSGNAAPLSFLVKAFPGSNIYRAEDMPVIDYLLLTHDHYDHLDFKTIRKLKKKVRQVICSLGVGAHLKYWGMEEAKITELDWWETAEPEAGMQIIAAPARHFSGRGIRRGQSLWSSFILRTAAFNLFLGGDSGYDAHFAAIGKKYGPFDLAVLESGQYNSMWPYIHMVPEEMVQAAADLGAKKIMPVHWGKFRLSMHPWNEPVRRVLKGAEAMNIPVLTPRIGEPVWLDREFKSSPWWDI